MLVVQAYFNIWKIFGGIILPAVLMQYSWYAKCLKMQHFEKWLQLFLQEVYFSEKLTELKQ